jgi:hypothetical protein
MLSAIGERADTRSSGRVAKAAEHKSISRKAKVETGYSMLDTRGT